MKTDTTKLFDEMLKDNQDTSDLTESQKIENQINEKIKESLGKMQTNFDIKLKEANEKINNILKEKNENEENEHSGSNEDLSLSDQEQNNIEGNCNSNI